MKYAPFLKDKDTIKLVAPSYGSPVDPYYSRLNKAIEVLEGLGYTILKDKNLYKLNKEASASAKVRAKELTDAYISSDNQFVWSIAGGEIMLLILDYLDIDKLRSAKAKWFMGYSDNTTFTYFLTTALDVASIYSYHIGTFCATPFKKYQTDVYDLIRGNKLSFNSYSKYETSTEYKNDNPIAHLKLTNPVNYRYLNGTDKLNITGRCIGGCIDVLEHIAGTKYDYTKQFIDKYQNDGFIWYFDVCELSSVGLTRVLFQLKATGWFKHVKAFLFSRIPNYDLNQSDLTYEDAIMMQLKEYKVPIIMDCDFGHVAPCIPIINGSILNFKYDEGKAKIKFILK